MLAMTEVYSLEGLGFLKSHVGVSVAMHYKFDKKLSYFLLKKVCIPHHLRPKGTGYYLLQNYNLSH